MKKLLLLLFILALPAYAIETQDDPLAEFSEETISTYNDKTNSIIGDLEDLEDNVGVNGANILWEEDGGDIELKTADDLDLQNKQIKGLVIENRTNDTGCTQTGRLWYRSDI